MRQGNRVTGLVEKAGIASRRRFGPGRVVQPDHRLIAKLRQQRRRGPMKQQGANGIRLRRDMVTARFSKAFAKYALVGC